MLNRLFASKKRPCFNSSPRWQVLNYDLSGCQFGITLPPQDYEFPEEKWGSQFNLFDSNWYRYDEAADRNGYPPTCKGISDAGILIRKWSTYGPIWRADRIGVLQCSAVVCDKSRMKPDLDCFNPGQFERLLVHGLYYTYGPGFGLDEYSTPVNWHIKTINNVEWIYFESWSRKAEWEAPDTPFNYDSDFTVSICAPLFKDKYLKISFVSTGSVPACSSNELMHSRIRTIISNLRLQLSPESVKQQADTKQRYPNIRYSPSRQPEDWRYYGSYRVGNFIADEESIVFEGRCSPPPKLY